MGFWPTYLFFYVWKEILTSMKNKLLSGAFWMSFGSIFSRVLGILYIIAWLAMFHSPQQQYTAQALYNAAYTPYGLFLALGTSGFPTAISRKIAYYNSRKRYLDSKRLFKAGLLFMALSGLICGLFFFIFAPTIAKSSPIMDQAAATFVLRSLVPALMILPTMSIIRGWFQGHQDMKPFGVSQLIEQFIRVVAILVFTFVSFNVLKQGLTWAVALSTFAAFIGALGSLAYLGKYYRAQLSTYRANEAESLPASQLDIKGLFLEIVKEAVPFVFVGAGVTINQIIDQLTFKHLMLWASNYDMNYIQNMFTFFSANPTKITTIIISLATALSDTSLPILAGLVGNRQKIAQTLSDNFKLMITLLIPFVAILTVLAQEVNTIFFGYNWAAGQLMAASIMLSLILSFFLDVSTLIQALGKHRLAVILLSFSLLLKLALQAPLIWLFHEYGALLATTIAFASSLALGLWYLNRTYLTDRRANLSWLKPSLGIGIYVLGLRLLAKPLSLLSLGHGKVAALITCVIFGLVAGSYYLVIAYLFRFKDLLKSMNR